MIMLALISVGLLAIVLLSAMLSLRLRQAWLALITLFSALFVPTLVGQGIAIPALTAAQQAWAYVVLAGLLVLWRRQLEDLSDSFTAVGITGYLLALLTTIGYASVAGPATILLTGLVLALGLYVTCGREPLPEAFVYLSAAISAYALMQLTDVYGWPISFHGLILATFGALLYLAGQRSELPQRANPLRYSGLILAFLGLYPGLLSGIPPLEPVTALFTGGILLWFESRRQGSQLLAELSGGVIVLAFDWLLRHEQVAQLQWYTLPAAAYFGYLAYRRRALPRDAYDLLVAASLAFLTVPLAAQVFGLKLSGYGPVLVLEAIGLIIAGSSLGYKLITRWGMVTLAAALLYQIPHLITLVQELYLTL